MADELSDYEDQEASAAGDLSDVRLDESTGDFSRADTDSSGKTTPWSASSPIPRLG
ncbi:MAG: hypothetical protein MI757_10895 [Pirellulales bacterium]|nr:hypothetical protein [Pirellulales bacterium]